MNDTNEDLDIIFEKFKTKFKVFETVTLSVMDRDYKLEYHGRCITDLAGDYFIVGKNRFKKIKPLKIEIHRSGNPNHDKLTLLHEMAHAITDYCERKTKSGWIVMDHNRNYYENFLTIMNSAYDMKIVDEKYTIESLRKIDCK